MSDYTPGPWRTTVDYLVHAPRSVERVHCVAETYGEDHVANANLIAAAPELYEVAKAYLAAIEQSADNGHYPPTLLTDDDRFPDGTEMLRDALAKAEGE